MGGFVAALGVNALICGSLGLLFYGVASMSGRHDPKFGNMGRTFALVLVLVFGSFYWFATTLLMLLLHWVASENFSGRTGIIFFATHVLVVLFYCLILVYGRLRQTLRKRRR